MMSIGDGIKAFLDQCGQGNPYESEIKRSEKELILLRWKSKVFERLRGCGRTLDKNQAKAMTDLGDFDRIGHFLGVKTAEELEQELNNINS